MDNYNDKDKLEKYLTDFNIFNTFVLGDLCIMDNPLKKGIKQSFLSFNNGYNFIICTGDNVNNSLIVAECIFDTKNINKIFVDTNTSILENSIYIFNGSNNINILSFLLKLKKKICYFCKLYNT